MFLTTSTVIAQYVYDRPGVRLLGLVLIIVLVLAGILLVKKIMK
jgi:hypothetical protein